MNIKSLGLEELSLSEKKEVNGGIGAVGVALIIAGLLIFGALNAY